MLDQNGMVQLDLYPPKANDNISFPLNIEVKLLISSPLSLHLYIFIYKYTIWLFTCMYMQAQYLNLHEWFPATNQATSLSNEYIQAVLKTEKPMVYILIKSLSHYNMQNFSFGDNSRLTMSCIFVRWTIISRLK